MKQETASLVTIGGLVVLAVIGTAVAGQVMSLDARIAALARKFIAGAVNVQKIEEDVKRPDGRITHVTTERREGESEADFVARHDSLVRYLQQN